MSTDHVTPLAATAAAAAVDRPRSDEKDPNAPPPSSRRIRRRCLVCCGSCTALVVVAIALVLVLIALTVYKVRDPVMTMNSISIENLNISAGSSPASPLAVNVTVVADVSVKNPNAVSFRFGGSTTSIYYRDREMGVAYGPPGAVGAHETFRVNATVNVIADRLLADPNLMGDLASGKVDVTTSTRVGGRVKIFLVVRHHVDVVMNCTVTVAVSVSNQSILGQSCNQRVWL